MTVSTNSFSFSFSANTAKICQMSGKFRVDRCSYTYMRIHRDFFYTQTDRQTLTHTHIRIHIPNSSKSSCTLTLTSLQNLLVSKKNYTILDRQYFSLQYSFLFLFLSKDEFQQKKSTHTIQQRKTPNFLFFLLLLLTISTNFILK